MTVRAIIFDCDGTLVDSETLGSMVMSEYLSELGMPLSPEWIHHTYRGSRMADCVADLGHRRGEPLPPEFVEILRQRMAEAIHRQLQPMPGAAELLNSIELPMAVASNGPLGQVRLSLTVTGLIEHFGERVFSAYDVGAWKPDPRLFLTAASAMQCSPDSCIVIEDSDLGVAAARAAGMHVYHLGGQTPATHPGVTPLQQLIDLLPHLARRAAS
ncbi:MAG: HAD-IA family hydrolase [Planctomycetaceae bacterium]